MAEMKFKMDPKKAGVDELLMDTAKSMIEAEKSITEIPEEVIAGLGYYLQQVWDEWYGQHEEALSALEDEEATD